MLTDEVKVWRSFGPNHLKIRKTKIKYATWESCGFERREEDHVQVEANKCQYMRFWHLETTTEQNKVPDEDIINRISAPKVKTS